MDLVFFLILTCHIANPSAKFNRAEYLSTVKPGFNGQNCAPKTPEIIFKKSNKNGYDCK